MSEAGRAETRTRYRVGQRVRIHDRHPGIHHRVPAYVKGQRGVIERICAMHGQPEKFIRGDGKPEVRLYRVRIAQSQLWPDYQGPAEDSLDVEIFEHWLEPA